jgi:hypothetical protein
MKKKNPDITSMKPSHMVDKYWQGVPVFKEFCDMKQGIAKNEMICTTATGRVIDFKSQMEALHYRKPSELAMQNYYDYRDFNRKAEKAKKEGDSEKEFKVQGRCRPPMERPGDGCA